MKILSDNGLYGLIQDNLKPNYGGHSTRVVMGSEITFKDRVYYLGKVSTIQIWEYS